MTEKKTNLTRRNLPTKSRNPKSAIQDSYYSKVLDEAEKLEFVDANNIEGLDDEITILRMKIKALLKNEPKNTALILAATNMLMKLVKTKYGMSKEQEKGLGEAIKNVIRDIGVPLGVEILRKKL